MWTRAHPWKEEAPRGLGANPLSPCSRAAHSARPGVPGPGLVPTWSELWPLGAQVRCCSGLPLHLPVLKRRLLKADLAPHLCPPASGASACQARLSRCGSLSGKEYLDHTGPYESLRDLSPEGDLGSRALLMPGTQSLAPEDSRKCWLKNDNLKRRQVVWKCRQVFIWGGDPL